VNSVYLATSPAWSAILVREFESAWPFVLTTLSKLKNSGHFEQFSLFVIQPEGASGLELGRMVDGIGRLRCRFPQSPVIAVGRATRPWEWELRESGASAVVKEIQQSNQVVEIIRRHFEKYPLPVGNPMTNQIVHSLPWGSHA
jgi:hypothetical protein